MLVVIKDDTEECFDYLCALIVVAFLMVFVVMMVYGIFWNFFVLLDICC